MVVDDGPTVDDGESMEVMVAELMPEVLPELQQLMQVTPQVAPQVAPQPVLGIRARKRIEEDELLLRYESMLGACANARAELSHAIGMSVGTLDGVLARALFVLVTSSPAPTYLRRGHTTATAPTKPCAQSPRGLPKQEAPKGTALCES